MGVVMMVEVQSARLVDLRNIWLSRYHVIETCPNVRKWVQPRLIRSDSLQT
jgi:hypothetical protein